MRTAISSDHTGVDLKRAIVAHLTEQGHAVKDFGTNSTDSVAFADFAYPAALALSEGKADRAILIDGVGYASAMVANKLPNVFAAVANDTFSARMAREHSHCKALGIGAKVVGVGLALDIVDAFMAAEELGGKYADRVAKVRDLAARHIKDDRVAALETLTEDDLRRAVEERRSLIIGPETIITPGALARARGVS